MICSRFIEALRPLCSGMYSSTGRGLAGTYSTYSTDCTVSCKDEANPARLEPQRLTSAFAKIE